MARKWWHKAGRDWAVFMGITIPLCAAVFGLAYLALSAAGVS